MKVYLFKTVFKKKMSGGGTLKYAKLINANIKYE